jgi:hypothetical protein
MAKMRWWKLEWERKIHSHEPLADPDLSVPTERQRQKQQRRRKKGGAKTIPRSKRRQRIVGSRAEAQDSFHSATLRAVARVLREGGTRDSAVIARELGISEATAAKCLSELERRG